MRGRGAHNGGGRGRGRGNGSFASATPKRTSSVPAFPVVSRGEPAAAVRSSSTANPSSTHRPARYDHDEDAPPVAVSARSSHDSAAAEEKGRGFVPPSAASSRGGRGGDVQRGGRGRDSAFRGGFDPRGGRGGVFRGGRGAPARGGRGSASPRRFAREDPDDEDRDHSHQHQHQEAEGTKGRLAQLTRVITTVTESGTELPRRLNTKVFIDGLPYTYEAEGGKPSLEDEVLQFASAWKVGKPLRLIKKPGQGFGFLVLQSPNSVTTAVRVLNGRKFLGRSLRVEEPKPKDLEMMKDIGGMKDMGKDSFTRQVLLTDLAKVAQPEIIREVLRDVAPQLEKKLEAIKMTSQNRKAFLTFESEAEVEVAVKFLNGFHLLGRRISATQAAAPGSLSYSHGGTGPSRGGLAAAARAAAGGHAMAGEGAAGEYDNDEDELTVVPLGMQPVKSTITTTSAASSSSTSARPKRGTDTAAAATSAGIGSNVTGRTVKYNLLDQGPSDVYVGNLGDDITEMQLRQHFTPCGAIRKCEILVHPETHLSTGIARIEFALPAYAAYAKEHYHGSRLRGCVLRVDRGEEASTTLAAELPPTAAAEEYDPDAYMEKYGVRDKKAYFKGTSVAAEMGADLDYDDDEEEEDAEEEEVEEAKPAKSKKKAPVTDAKTKTGDKKGKRARAEAAAAEAAVPAKKAKTDVKRSAAAAATEEEEGDSDIHLITSGIMDDSDDEEERFYDADTVPVAAGAAGSAGGKRAKSGGKKPKKSSTAKGKR